MVWSKYPISQWKKTNSSGKTSWKGSIWHFYLYEWLFYKKIHFATPSTVKCFACFGHIIVFRRAINWQALGARLTRPTKLVKIMRQHAALKNFLETTENRSPKIDWFYHLHTKQTEHLDHNIGLSIKNKSSKRKLSRGEGLTSNTPSDQTVGCDA